MQITAVPPSITTTKLADTPKAETISGVSGQFQEGVRDSIDFTRITPRQLNAYLDRMIEADQIDPMDATVLGNVFSTEEYEKFPDTPVNVRAQLQGTLS